MIINRRSLLISLGLTLPVAATAEAATALHKKKPTHHSGAKTASAKSHTRPHVHHAAIKPTQS